MEELVNLTRGFTSKDFVIVAAGTNDLEAGSYPRMRYINNKLKNCLHTNIILLSPCLRGYQYISETLNYNKNLYNFLNYVNRITENCILYVGITNSVGDKLSNFSVSQLLHSAIIDAPLLKLQVKNLNHVKMTDLNEKRNNGETMSNDSEPDLSVNADGGEQGDDNNKSNLGNGIMSDVTDLNDELTDINKVNFLKVGTTMENT